MTHSQKLIVAVVAALAAGFLIGHYVIAPDGPGDPVEPPTRGFGEPPCAHVPPLPPGQWPNVQCGSKSACQLMEQIWSETGKAMAKRPPTISQILHDSIMMALGEWASAPPDPGADAARCAALEQALAHALEGNWPQVFSVIQDIPMGG